MALAFARVDGAGCAALTAYIPVKNRLTVRSGKRSKRMAPRAMALKAIPTKQRYTRRNALTEAVANGDGDVETDDDVEEIVPPAGKGKPAGKPVWDPSVPDKIRAFDIWLIGLTPLICHAWSEKARIAMLQKQLKVTTPGREERDPEQDYVDSLYKMGDAGGYGFPATGIKNCILSAAHKDRGIPRTDARSALYIDAELVSTRAAFAAAICDMPLLRIWGSDPVMREDMVRVGAGLNKTASLAYRAQFTDWAIRITGTVNALIMTPDALRFLITQSGQGYGLGDWRNEKNGVFGAFRMANGNEERNAWIAFSEGRGPLPVRSRKVSV
jgi:hypothetical protein